MESITKALKEIQVSEVFFCSGARNHSLHPIFKDFKIHHHFDERSASFMALGLSKSSKRPVVICTTSGSAVLECLSALAEAYYSGTKIVLITADRSKEHINCGFPQTIDQITPITPFVKEQYLIESWNCPEIEIKNFPIHINIYTEKSKSQKQNQKINPRASTLLIFSEGAHVVNGNKIYQKHAQSLLHYLEPNCNIERINSRNEIYSELALQKLLSLKKISQIIRIGRCPITRVWRELNDNKDLDISVFHLDPESMRRLTYGTLISSEDLIEIDFEHHQTNIKQSCIDDLLTQYPNSEPALLKEIVNSIPLSTSIFLGNSLVIRNFKLVSSRVINIFSNRGINGIDGSIATAIGLAKTQQNEVIAIMGDLTFLYDLNALIMKMPENLKIIVINNNGGRIFEQIKPPFKEIICEHSISIKKITASLNINQKKLIEVHVDNEQTKMLIKKWEEQYA